MNITDTVDLTKDNEMKNEVIKQDENEAEKPTEAKIKKYKST